METQDKLGPRNTIISYSEMSNFFSKRGEKSGHCFDTSKPFALYCNILTEQPTLICMEQTAFDI